MNKIQEDLYGKYATGYYKYCLKCGAYMVDEVQPNDKNM